MGYYLYEHPPARSQFIRPRRAPISGVVVVHTTESALDRIAPDTGAENVAGFIARRTDAGSYHEIVDTDSVVRMLPDDVEAFGCATGDNPHVWHIALAARSSELSPTDPATRQMVATAGRRIALFWERNNRSVTVARRWLTQDQARSRTMSGLINHGTLQPVDRSDAWARHPHKAGLDRLLLDAITLPAEDDEMPEQKVLLRDKNGKIWVAQGITKVHVPSPEHADVLRYIGVQDNTGPDSTKLLETLGTLPNGL